MERAGSDAETYAARPHVRRLAEGLRHPIELLREAIVNRPVPSDSVVQDVPAAIESAVARMSGITSDVTAAFNGLGAVAAHPAPLDDDLQRALSGVSVACEALCEVHRAIWRDPYPPGFETGQALLSAMQEKLMRTTLDALERIVAAALDPAGAVRRYGSSRIHVAVVLEVDREGAMLTEWVRGKFGPTPGRSSGRGWGRTLLAFGIGWLLGRSGSADSSSK